MKDKEISTQKFHNLLKNACIDITIFFSTAKTYAKGAYFYNDPIRPVASTRKTDTRIISAKMSTLLQEIISQYENQVINGVYVELSFSGNSSSFFYESGAQKAQLQHISYIVLGACHCYPVGFKNFFLKADGVYITKSFLNLCFGLDLVQEVIFSPVSIDVQNLFLQGSEKTQRNTKQTYFSKILELDNGAYFLNRFNTKSFGISIDNMLLMKRLETKFLFLNELVLHGQTKEECTLLCKTLPAVEKCKTIHTLSVKFYVTYLPVLYAFKQYLPNCDLKFLYFNAARENIKYRFFKGMLYYYGIICCQMGKENSFGYRKMSQKRARREYSDMLHRLLRWSKGVKYKL
eukprot:snap_masked-scaffold_18-processed-gene-1.15-mRNA-1 protein AED:1.00 eAED:1.00 QI:0/0/0/0/1/1/2/0/346